MAENNKCSIVVDGTAGTARLTIEGRDAKSVGVLFPGYVVGQPITVPEGSKKIVTLYNGLQKGTIAFDIVFSGAKKMVAASATIVAMTMLY